MKHTRFSLFLFVLLVSFAANSWAQVATSPSIYDKFSHQQKVNVIIKMKEDANYPKDMMHWSKEKRANYTYQALVDLAERSQSSVIAILEGAKLSHQSFYVVNAIKSSITSDILDVLENRNDIEAIIDDAPMKMLDYTEEIDQTQNRVVEPEWGIKKIKADSVWLQGHTGQGVTLGGLDTGFAWDFDVVRSKYRGYLTDSTVNHSYHWHDAIHDNNPAYPDSLANPCGFDVKQPCDDNNHGTHTMGTMVGQDANNQIGVAPGARWVACRNMDRGWGMPSTYIECFEWMLAPTDSSGLNPSPVMSPHVINNSWYCSESEGCNSENRFLLDDAVKNLKAAGVVVVISAGNSGPNCGTIDQPPALFRSSFAVGATNDQDGVAGFSSRGPSMIDSIAYLKPNVSAPGVGVRSIIRNGGFASFSGTSMAGPHVAGTVALMISANPSLAGRVEIIENILERTADPFTSDQNCGSYLGSAIPNAVYGYGRINALRAVEQAKAFIIATEQVQEADLKLFPNPVQDIVKLDVGNQVIQQVIVFDQSGKTVTSVYPSLGAPSIALPLSHWTRGIYMVKVVMPTGVKSGRFVKI